MHVPMNDLGRAISRDREVLMAAFERVLDSGYVVMGPHHRAFEESLADYLGVAHALGVASGTDALELAIKAVMPEGRGTVVTAANAGGYTSIATRRAGFALTYADVDPVSLCLSAETVAAALHDDVGVVVVTHLYGNLTEMGALVALCRSRGIRLIEDCAQAIGARRDEGGAATFGDIAAFSFYPTKNLGAIGDGGAIATDNPDFAARAAQLRQYGWSSKYDIGIPGGVNSRLDEVQAAFLLARLPTLEAGNETRRRIIARYRDAAAGGPLEVLPAEGAHHVAHLAVGRSAKREQVRAHLLEQGVATDIHFPIPDHRQPGLGSAPVSLPHTERAAAEVLSLPCFPELTDDEINHVCRAIASLSTLEESA